MRVLLLTPEQRLPNLCTLYQHLGKLLTLDIRRLDKTQQLQLRSTLADVDLHSYQRIIVDLPFRNIQNQSAFLSTLSGVLIYEEDACQNYLPRSRHQGEFSRFYARVPNARVVVTGAALAESLRGEGVDASFLAKGYDPQRLFVEPQPRDIELGFIGRVDSAEYADRQRLLLQLAACEPLRLLRTTPGEAYRQMLNRIRLFVSADIGLGEYMGKNFEAMACGCLLLAWRQGYEEVALGLREGEHLLLYSSLQELREHIRQLRGDPQRVQRIAAAGCEWVRERHSYLLMAEQLAELLRQPWPADTWQARPTWWQSVWPF